MIKNKNQVAIAVLFAILLTGSLIYYFNYKIQLVKQDYESKISDLSQNLDKNFKSLKNDVGNLGSNMSSQIGILDARLENFKKQNQKDLNTLLQLIDQIEQQSNIKLDELKNEVKNIRIQSADFSAIVNDVLQSVVSVGTNLGQGSGAIIDEKGYIVTNVHVISGASTINVVTYSGNTYKAILAGYDVNADIAVLKIETQNLKALDFGNSNDIVVGERVIAAGNPAGLSFTVTEGIVSAFRTFNDIKYVQTDVPINPGNSGGPLLNPKGEIIGINNFKVGGFESLGFAISSNEVKSVTNKIISDYEAKQNQ